MKNVLIRAVARTVLQIVGIVAAAAAATALVFAAVEFLGGTSLVIGLIGLVVALGLAFYSLFEINRMEIECEYEEKSLLEGGIGDDSE